MIKEEIIEGRLAADEWFVVTDLARRHDTSTSPVREALRLLRGEGFVISVPSCGARVRAHRSGIFSNRCMRATAFGPDRTTVQSRPSFV
jgi:DNA-binding GntR family transcriptional regulator